jgi:excisionase family DNA binding protein
MRRVYKTEKAATSITYYVYTLAKPDGTVFYVGKGQGDRIHKHEEHAAYSDKLVEKYGLNLRKCNIIREILASGQHVLKNIVYETTVEEEAYAHERRLICEVYGLEQLANCPYPKWRYKPRKTIQKRSIDTNPLETQALEKVLQDILDADEVAAILRIHPRTVKRLANDGELPGFKVGGQWRFRREAIEEYIRKQEHKHDKLKEDG